MGLFSWLVEKACDFIDYLSEKTEEFLENTVGRVIDWITGSNDLNSAPAYKPEVATIDETAKFNELLTKKRDEFTDICNEYERKIKEASENIFSLFITYIGEINKKFKLTISVKYIQNEFEEFKKNIEGGISGLVNRRLALSDTECAEILGHEAGDKRSVKIDRFLRKIVREGSQKYINNFDRIISQAVTLVNDQIKGAYSEKMILAQKAKEELEGLNRELSDLETKEKKEEFEYKIGVINQVFVY